MNTKQGIHRNSKSEFVESRLALHLDAYKTYLIERGYSASVVRTYLSCFKHFARWLNHSRLNVHRIDETTVHRFLDAHLPHCNCTKPACRNRIVSRAALGHLIVVLRVNSVIAEVPLGTRPVDVELRCFDEHMSDVKGLAPKTRSHYLHIVRNLLSEQFAHRPVTISTIMPADVRRFIASQSALYSTPASAGILASALRGYFRYRTFRGDQVQHLLGVVCYPANWQGTSAPSVGNS